MIAYLKGIIISKSKDHVVVLVDHLGYEIFVPQTILEQTHLGEEHAFFTHEHIREDARDLFGFLNELDLELFKKLIKVSGVGPKTALNVMALGTETVRDAITRGEVGILSSVSGVGKKTAQKIVLELKGVLSETGISLTDTEAVEALKRLGYSQREAHEALKQSPGTTSEEKLKAALQILGKR